ncbi:hypothetical protein FRC03_000174 [Tulasnella sp. 419]|nr:hypothetical protein FRC03_000174 [Tulasnella sp. 419]
MAEHVNLQALSARSIRLGYTPDVLTDAVADISIMLALMASRNALSALKVVETGRWPSLGWAPFGFCGPQLGSGPTLPWPDAPMISPPEFTAGFLGFGRISKAVLHRLIPFGITRAVYTTSGKGKQRTEEEDQALVEKYKGFGSLKEVKRVDLDELAKQSDVLFTLVPGGPETRHIISTDFLFKMKSTSILVNTGRGSIVDSDALAEALNNNQIYAAGLDVIEGEPNVDTDHPLVKCPKAVVLPHIASATIQTRLAMSTLAAKNLVAGVLGEEIPVELKK